MRDRGENATRFGCGFVFGLVLGGFAAARVFYDSGYTVLAVTVFISTFLGILAMRYGDRIWYSLKHWIWFLS